MVFAREESRRDAAKLETPIPDRCLGGTAGHRGVPRRPSRTRNGHGYRQRSIRGFDRRVRAAHRGPARRGQGHPAPMGALVISEVSEALRDVIHEATPDLSSWVVTHSLSQRRLTRIVHALHPTPVLASTDRGRTDLRAGDLRHHPQKTCAGADPRQRLDRLRPQVRRANLTRRYRGARVRVLREPRTCCLGVRVGLSTEVSWKTYDASGTESLAITASSSGAWGQHAHGRHPARRVGRVLGDLPGVHDRVSPSTSPIPAATRSRCSPPRGCDPATTSVVASAAGACHGVAVPAVRQGVEEGRHRGGHRTQRHLAVTRD